MTILDTTAETKRKRPVVAKHEYLNSAGQVVDDESNATGYQYTMLKTGETFTWQWADANEAERMKLAIFGTKTLATNETSAVRNSEKNDGRDEDELAAEGMEALRSRFGFIRDGLWNRPSEGGGVGTRVNKDALAEAICLVLVAAGRKTDKEVEAGYKAQVRDRLESDSDWLAKVRKQPEVLVEYTRITGKAAGKTMTVDDLLT